MTWYFPDDDENWERVSADEIGWDGDAFTGILSEAEARNSTGLVILHRGRLLLESYWRGADRNTTDHVASVQKSILSLLFGAAILEGRLNLDDAVSTHLGAGWSSCDPPDEQAITLRHVLSMTSGLDDRLQRRAAPGRGWYYNDNAYFRGGKAALEAAIGETTESYCRRHLWRPLGTRAARWEQLSFTMDPLGCPIEGVHATPRDLARIGLMLLAGGAWRGGPLPIDQGFLNTSIRRSQEANPAYGLLWWVNDGPSHMIPGPVRMRFPGQIVPSAPPDMIAALGADDKKLYICPSLDLVVVRLGPLAARPGDMLFDFDTALWRAIVAAAPGKGRSAFRDSAHIMTTYADRPWTALYTRGSASRVCGFGVFGRGAPHSTQRTAA